MIEKFQLPINVIGTAGNGSDALSLVYALRPDILFLDIEMPLVNGLEVMERIKAQYPGTVKIIVITAYSNFEYAQLSLRLGARDILLKPVDSNQFIEMMSRVLGYKYTNNRIFNDIIEYVNKNCEKNLSLSDCASKFHISPNYITRMFTKYTSVSFIEYINGLRIKRARELLTETDLSIKEVAERAGYNNLNYFYRKFKEGTGLTPNEFKSNKGKP